MKKTHDERHEPPKRRGVLPGTPGDEPDLGPGLWPGTLSEKREDESSRSGK